MRELNVQEIIEPLAQACISINCCMGADVRAALAKAAELEESPQGQAVFKDLLENGRIAEDQQIPICQDTGMAVIFARVGQELRLVGGDLTQAIQEGVRLGYERGYLRKSVVKHPWHRENTGDNTPAVIHYEIVAGECLTLELSAKGFGSENMGALGMLSPSQGLAGVKEFVVTTVSKAGGNPCPPVIVGVGVGGTMEKAALLAKKALLRPLGSPAADKETARIEAELLVRINGLGIGPQGYGGRMTALGVHLETYPTHIAGLPVAVNLNCHVSRHKVLTWEGQKK